MGWAGAEGLPPAIKSEGCGSKRVGGEHAGDEARLAKGFRHNWGGVREARKNIDHPGISRGEARKQRRYFTVRQRADSAVIIETNPLAREAVECGHRNVPAVGRNRLCRRIAENNKNAVARLFWFFARGGDGSEYPRRADENPSAFGRTHHIYFDRPEGVGVAHLNG